MTKESKLKKGGKPKPSWIDVKRKISSFDRAGLIQLVSDLYAMNRENKAFLHARFRLGTAQLDGYKQRIRAAVAPDITGRRIKDPSPSSARKVISEYNKAVGDALGLQELRLCWCEAAVDFAVSCGFEDESYFDALTRQYRDACLALIEVPEASRQTWADRLIEIRNRAQVGYGVQDAMDYWLAEAEI
jgi:hypothetical protein